jgi:hypothetical protein
VVSPSDDADIPGLGSILPNLSKLSTNDANDSLGLGGVDISYAAPQAHGIVNVAFHREYSPSIIFIFSHERKDLYHV